MFFFVQMIDIFLTNKLNCNYLIIAIVYCKITVRDIFNLVGFSNGANLRILVKGVHGILKLQELF